MGAKGKAGEGTKPPSLRNSFLFDCEKLVVDTGAPVSTTEKFTWNKKSGGFLNPAVADAGGARTKTLGSSVHDGTHELKVHVPAPLRHVMGVTDAVAELRTLPTDFTNSCHCRGTPSKMVQNQFSNRAVLLQPRDE